MSTAALADLVVSLDPEDIPADVRRYAAVLLTDVLGAGVYGSGTEQAGIVHEYARRSRRTGPAVVWGRSATLEPAAAALVNGTQAHAYELDDYHPGGKLHPGAAVVPAALATAARRPVSGTELLTAIVVGYEVMIRVSLAADAAAVRRRGWHLTGLAGPLGAAAAAGRLLGLDAERLLHALGISGSFSAGLFAFSRTGAMTKRLHAGRAAEGGIMAAELAADGFTGPPDVLEAGDGGLLGAVSDVADTEALAAGLGARFAIADVAIKPYPCCGSLHSFIDAVLDLTREHGVDADDIAEVVAHGAAVVEQQCGYPYTGAGGVLEAQMSLQYCLAVAAVDRSVSVEQFTTERRSDPRVCDLARRVAFEVDPEIDRAYPLRFSARVHIRTRSGQALQRLVETPRGSAQRPYNDADAAAKFHGLCRTVLDDATRESVLCLLRGLEEIVDVTELTARLATSR